MAVTINDMQVDVNKPAPAANSGGSAKSQDKSAKPDFRREMEMRAERDLRLRAD